MNAHQDESQSEDNRRAEARARAPARGGSEATAAPASDPKRIVARDSQYMVAPAGLGLAERALVERLKEVGGFEVIRSIAARGLGCPPVAVVRTSPDRVVALRQSHGGAFVVELDRPLRAASAAFVSSAQCAAAIGGANRCGAAFTTTIQVLNQDNAPLEHVDVQLVGQQFGTSGLTGGDGKVALTLHGELADTVMELVIKPRAGYWGLWKSRPDLQDRGVNVIILHALPDLREPGWGAQAMRFDRLPPEYRGAGVKLALIDSGASTAHRQLRHLQHGFDAHRGDERSWSKDPTGHGTFDAGIMAAKPDAGSGIRGYAADAELQVYQLPFDACCSDLVAALDDCLVSGIDIACVGYGCERGSAIAEQRIVAAKQRGMAVIAAAGSTGGPIQFPACSLHVLAVGAIGQVGTFPEDSPHAAHAAAATALGRGLLAPVFSCTGPELDLCGPGMAVISCGLPQGYVAGDGTSVAAPHIAALAALVLAHRSDCRRQLANRDAARVAHLFQILKAAAHPLGHPGQTGAGLPDAPCALGLQAAFPHPRSVVPLEAGLAEMRGALRRAGLLGSGAAEPPEPPRGPAAATDRPLSFVPPVTLGASSVEAGLHELRNAMQLAGLCADR